MLLGDNSTSPAFANIQVVLMECGNEKRFIDLIKVIFNITRHSLTFDL